MYDFRDIAENGHSENDYFREKLTKNHIQGEFLRIREFTLAIFVIFPQNGKLRLKTKILKFLGIQSIYAIEKYRGIGIEN